MTSPVTGPQPARPWAWRVGLLERGAELRAVEDALAGLHDGRSQVVLIQGVMGMGKTALLAAATSRAAELGLRVRQARCCVHDRRVRFAAVRQLHASPARTGAGPEVLAVDDLHDADAWSVSWLAERAAAEGPRPALLIATVCDDEGEAAGSGRRGLPGARVLRPGPLSLVGVGRLTAATLGLPLPLDDPSCLAWLRECLRLTAGHPLWVRELLDRAARTPGLAPMAEAAGTLPALAAEVVSEVLAARLDRQHPGALRLAQAVSVLGDRCDLATAAALAELPGGQARDALQVLARIGLVSGSGGALAFPDPLVRHAVAASMPASALAASSAEAASLLHRNGAPPARIAIQLLRGERLSAGWATTVLLQAARQRQRRTCATRSRCAATRASAPRCWWPTPTSPTSPASTATARSTAPSPPPSPRCGPAMVTTAAPAAQGTTGMTSARGAPPAGTACCWHASRHASCSPRSASRCRRPCPFPPRGRPA